MGTSPKQETLWQRINRLVNDKINISFRDFYQTEIINLDLSFNAGVVSFVIQSEGGETLMFSKRSNGLKWYFESIINVEANDIVERNVVYLLDEPGISLHVNAQRDCCLYFKIYQKMGIR